MVFYLHGRSQPPYDVFDETIRAFRLFPAAEAATRLTGNLSDVVTASALTRASGLFCQSLVDNNKPNNSVNSVLFNQNYFIRWRRARQKGWLS